MVTTITVQLYGHGGNNAVVQLPDRKHVGVVIQLDTLQGLVDDARHLAAELIAAGLASRINDQAIGIAEQLESILLHLKSEIAMTQK